MARGKIGSPGFLKLLSTDHMLTNLELGKLCVQVEKHRCTDIFPPAQEAELGTSDDTF